MINCGNIWNDPYHASKRTWKSFHARTWTKMHPNALSSINTHRDEESHKRNFVIRARSATRQRLQHRRELNRRRATSASNDFLHHPRQPRQDVCSGLTKPIAGSLDELPYKAIRNLMTPLIESMDAAATNSLANRLREESCTRERAIARRAQVRSEILQELHKREEYTQALERLSGITRPPSLEKDNDSRGTSERILKLAQPREVKSMMSDECLDGLELVHITHPDTLNTLHKKIACMLELLLLLYIPAFLVYI